MNNLYAQHIDAKMAVYQSVFATTPWRRIAVHAGSEHMQFLDDLAYPYKPNPYFSEWLPLADRPDAYLLVDSQRARPQLLLKQQEDFWHSPPASIPADIAAAFDIDHYRTQAQPRRYLALDRASVLIAEGGSAAAGELSHPAEQHNNAAVLHLIDFQRACKSAYEIDCIGAANRIAVQGHRAAQAAFRAGGSEYAIHQAYLTATQQTESELPYGNICALNEHAAILHHMRLHKRAPAAQRSLLIDAGASCAGYAADVTRTYQADPQAQDPQTKDPQTKDPQTKDPQTRDPQAQKPLQDGDFAALLAGIEANQQQLAGACRPGADYLDLHLSMHAMLTQLLCDMGVIKVSAQQAAEQGLSRAFCPHGLGHLIGIQVHDRGGHQCDPQGQLRPPPEQHASLRCTRTLAENMVVTIEPGAYFIPGLLQPLRQAQPGSIDWALVDKLMPFGGVRIEDNVLVTAGQPRNLTREAFAALSA